MDKTPAEQQPEPPAEAPEHDDALADSLALIECWAAVDAAESGSEAEHQAEAAMGLLLKHLGNPYATSLTMGKVFSQVREAWLTCPEDCCAAHGAQNFREWFSSLARSG